jgi:hypothetical protein
MMLEYFVMGALLLLLYFKRDKPSVSKSTQTCDELSPMDDDDSSENTSEAAFYYNVSSSKSNSNNLNKRPSSARTHLNGHSPHREPNTNPVIIETKSAGSCILTSDPLKKDS